MTGSIYSGMTDLEKNFAEFLKQELNFWWWYEYPVFVYDEKDRPRVWTPDFYIPKLGMFIEVCGSTDFDYEYREKIYKKMVIMLFLFKHIKKSHFGKIFC